VAPVLLVFLVALAASLHAWIEPVEWKDPDGLYYQAKTLSFRGEDERTALHEAFRSPIASELLEGEREALRSNPDQERQFTNPEWIDYTSRFFDRRPFVPLLAAGIYPLFELRSVLTVSLVGYLLLALALFAFLRRRFSPWLSAAVTSIFILAPPVRDTSFVPMTDSWGLFLMTCALLAAALVYERSERWLVGWIAALALLSVTRDDSVVPLVAVGCLLLHQRDRRSLLLVVSGALSILPAILIFGNASIKENLAYAFSGFNPPYEETWKFVLHYYPENLRNLISSDASYGTHLGAIGGVLWYLGLAITLVGVVLLVKRLWREDVFFRLAAYALPGAVLFVLLFGRWSALRQEIVFVPSLAVAVALVLERGIALVRERRSAAQAEPGRRQALPGQHLPENG
jgi:4-amino-4-deoxy-L-arabinose transferase-like glycosyltransferase